MAGCLGRPEAVITTVLTAPWIATRIRTTPMAMVSNTVQKEARLTPKGWLLQAGRLGTNRSRVTTLRQVVLILLGSDMSTTVELSIEGQVLTTVQMDSNVVLLFGANQEFRLRIMEEDFTISKGQPPLVTTIHFAAWARSPEGTTGISQLAALINHKVTTAGVDDNGVLTVGLEDGSTIVVRPKGTYEAWSFEGSGQILVCLGSGKISVFDPVSEDDKTVAELMGEK